MKLDFSNVTKKEFSPVPAGTYKVQVQAVTEEISAANKPYLNVELAIAEEPFVNKRVWSTLTTSGEEGKNWMLMSFLEAVGFTEDELRDPSFELDLAALSGVTLVAVLKEEPAQYEPDGTTIKYAAKNSVKKFVAS